MISLLFWVLCGIWVLSLMFACMSYMLPPCSSLDEQRRSMYRNNIIWLLLGFCCLCLLMQLFYVFPVLIVHNVYCMMLQVILVSMIISLYPLIIVRLLWLRFEEQSIRLLQGVVLFFSVAFAGVLMAFLISFPFCLLIMVLFFICFWYVFLSYISLRYSRLIALSV